VGPIVVSAQLGEIINVPVALVYTMTRNVIQIVILVETEHATLNAEKINVIVLKIVVQAVKMNALILGK
jgi:hypothetical protein